MMPGFVITVNGITAIGTTEDNTTWKFVYPDGTQVFTLHKIINEEGNIEYEYVYADQPECTHWISSTMFIGDSTIRDIAEWILGTQI